VLARAAELREGGNLRLACHLVEHAVVAEPASADVHALRAELYAAWAAEQSSSMARNILDHAAESSRQGKRDLAGDF
jgi:alkyl sulfatase BDS1-like metallo-beta-lactamase superfamily hydrolase